MSVFKAYDIRGIYNKDFNKEDVYRIGFFLPKLLNSDKVLVGRDVRTSSPEIFKYLCMGINDSGADVYDLGLTTTPMVYFATARYNFSASVQITASHNPKEYNGLKISRKGALPVGYETGLAELEEMVKGKDEILPSGNKGKIIKYDMKNDYIEFLVKYLPDISDLKVAVDCSNGMSAVLIKNILGDSPTYIYDTLDGTFPNHEPNPLIEENVEDLKRTVLDNNCDIGIIFDGDADRVMFVDEKCNFIRPDLIIGVMGHYFLEQKNGNVLHDIRTSKAVSEYIEHLGGVVHMWKVGHAFAKLKLREINGVFGGELAGHYYFKDFFYCDSGMLASLIVLNVVAKYKNYGISFSELISYINRYSNSGEINFKIEDKYKVMETLKNHFSQNEEVKAFYDFDGYRLEFKDWWFNVRPSNTEPYLRLVVEAKDEVLLEDKLSEIRNLIDS